MTNVRNCLTSLVAFAAGATVGALAGLLLAPNSGQETRRKLAQRYEDEKSELLRKGQRAVEETAQRLEEGIEGGKRKLTEALRT